MSAAPCTIVVPLLDDEPVWRPMMKKLTFVPIALLAVFATQAYAGDTSTSTMSADPSATVTTQESSGAPIQGATASGGMGKTRAQVYDELIRAQKDGTADRLKDLYQAN
jgi:hypothetical protein